MICCNWMIYQINNKSSYMYDFSFCNCDSHHDLPNSNIPPLHSLGMVQESNMCTSHHKRGYPYMSDLGNGLCILLSFLCNLVGLVSYYKTLCFSSFFYMLCVRIINPYFTHLDINSFIFVLFA